MNRRLARALLSLVGVGLALAAAEGIVRWIDPPSIRPELLQPAAGHAFAAAHMLMPVERDGLRYLGRPGAAVMIRDVEFRHNRLGLRGPEIASPKPSGTIRVLLLGDSNLYGWGVPWQETLGAQAQAALNESARDATRYEVVAGGIPGYNTADQLALLRRLLPVVQPDAVVLLWFANDIERLGFHVDRDGYLFCDPLPVPDRLKPWLWRSHLYRLVSSARMKRLRKSGQYLPASEPTRAYCAARIREMRDLLRERDVAFAVADLPVIEPNPADGYHIRRDGYYGERASAWLRDLAAAEGLVHDEWVDAIEGEVAALLWASIEHGDHHPNGKAHARFAAALVEMLRERGLLGS